MTFFRLMTEMTLAACFVKIIKLVKLGLKYYFQAIQASRHEMAYVRLMLFKLGNFCRFSNIQFVQFFMFWICAKWCLTQFNRILCDFVLELNIHISTPSIATTRKFRARNYCSIRSLLPDSGLVSFPFCIVNLKITSNSRMWIGKGLNILFVFDSFPI